MQETKNDSHQIKVMLTALMLLQSGSVTVNDEPIPQAAVIVLSGYITLLLATMLGFTKTEFTHVNLETRDEAEDLLNQLWVGKGVTDGLD